VLPTSVMGRMSAVSQPPERALFFVLKTYFDKSNDEAKSTMTLCCVAATDSVWTEIDGGWNEILGRHARLRLPGIHSKRFRPLTLASVYPFSRL
jgi:hypothetical protein